MVTPPANAGTPGEVTPGGWVGWAFLPRLPHRVSCAPPSGVAVCPGAQRQWGARGSPAGAPGTPPQQLLGSERAVSLPTSASAGTQAHRQGTHKGRHREP